MCFAIFLSFEWSPWHINRVDNFSCLLEQVTSIVASNLNKIIDVNFYPVETAKRSNIRHRPIGIGVQGLADTFILLGMPFDSPEVILRS